MIVQISHDCLRRKENPFGIGFDTIIWKERRKRGEKNATI